MTQLGGAQDGRVNHHHSAGVARRSDRWESRARSGSPDDKKSSSAIGGGLISCERKIPYPAQHGDQSEQEFPHLISAHHNSRLSMSSAVPNPERAV